MPSKASETRNCLSLTQFQTMRSWTVWSIGFHVQWPGMLGTLTQFVIQFNVTLSRTSAIISIASSSYYYCTAPLCVKALQGDSPLVYPQKYSLSCAEIVLSRQVLGSEN